MNITIIFIYINTIKTSTNTTITDNIAITSGVIVIIIIIIITPVIIIIFKWQSARATWKLSVIVIIISVIIDL